MKYFYIAETTCSGDITTCCSDYAVAKYVTILQKVLDIIHFIVPIILIIMATIGIIKLMLDPDDPQKKNWKSLTNKFLAAVLVYFVPFFVNILFAYTPNTFDISGCFEKANNSSNILDTTESYVANNTNYASAKKQLESLKSKTRQCYYPGICTKNAKKKYQDYLAYLEKIVSGEPYQYLDYSDFQKHGEVKLSDNSTSSLKIALSNKTYTNTSAKRNNSSNSSSTSAKSSSKDGKEVVKYAKQFVGNPYVYGGNSLTNGIDCSGYTQAIYSHFGISIPRTAQTQSVSSKGKKVSSIKDAQPGDLFFYSGNCSNGPICHVSMYAGNGKIVHAKGAKYGIVMENANYRTPTVIKRFL